ncbi:hypothetical protein BU23DRAFT_644786 [Bimuria novae-zelandiae CBS 107.79]|uniref:Uncharacterized protein n=1 Tax=Bimuria novae-zelandiae CBS 107.79 TaxID=1447943 RepID=A0A6A5V4U2_9PLEO|nr:hypothetical protein BU23DRAFT_644786 [Bimuria novae-zelandiae CBS 107.79]
MFMYKEHPSGFLKVTPANELAKKLFHDLTILCMSKSQSTVQLTELINIAGFRSDRWFGSFVLDLTAKHLPVTQAPVWTLVTSSTIDAWECTKEQYNSVTIPVAPPQDLQEMEALKCVGTSSEITDIEHMIKVNGKFLTGETQRVLDQPMTRLSIAFTLPGRLPLASIRTNSEKISGTLGTCFLYHSLPWRSETTCARRCSEKADSVPCTLQPTVPEFLARSS